MRNNYLKEKKMICEYLAYSFSENFKVKHDVKITGLDLSFFFCHCKL